MPRAAKFSAAVGAPTASAASTVGEVTPGSTMSCMPWADAKVLRMPWGKSACMRSSARGAFLPKAVFTASMNTSRSPGCVVASAASDSSTLASLFISPVFSEPCSGAKLFEIRLRHAPCRCMTSSMTPSKFLPAVSSPSTPMRCIMVTAERKPSCDLFGPNSASMPTGMVALGLSLDAIR